MLYRDELLLNDTFCVPNIIVFTIMWLSFSATNVWPEVFGGDWYKMHWNIFVSFEWHEHCFLWLNLGFQFTLNSRIELAEFGEVLGSTGVSHVWIDMVDFEGVSGSLLQFTGRETVFFGKLTIIYDLQYFFACFKMP